MNALATFALLTTAVGVLATHPPAAAAEALDVVALRGDDRPAGTRGASMCAAFDLHVLWRIEEVEDDEDAPAERLVQAAFDLQRARASCRSGRVSEALAIYSAIALPAGRIRWLQ